MNRIRLHSTRKNGEDFTGRVYLIELGFDQTYSGMSVPVRSGCTFKRVSVSRWWNLELIGIPTLQRPRRDLVLSLANKDGAHIDPRLGQDDRALRAFGNIVYSTESQIGDGWTETNYHYPRFPLHACIRQMAHEVLATPALKPWIGTAL
ncbi:MAG TPA: hypothetical protein PKA27_14315 [Fimbriimonadaceae bacterium]|nr:hypothetical protein [Fimbriimonadaceae bacterium]